MCWLGNGENFDFDLSQKAFTIVCVFLEGDGQNADCGGMPAIGIKRGVDSVYERRD